MWVPMATNNLALWVQGGTKASLRLIVRKKVMDNNSLFEVKDKGDLSSLALGCLDALRII